MVALDEKSKRLQFILWGDMNVWTKFHGSTSKSCRDISLRTTTTPWRYKKSQWIIKVSRIHPLGTMNVYTKFIGNPSSSCRDISVGKWWTNGQTGIFIPASMTNKFSINLNWTPAKLKWQCFLSEVNLQSLTFLFGKLPFSLAGCYYTHFFSITVHLSWSLYIFYHQHPFLPSLCTVSSPLL